MVTSERNNPPVRIDLDDAVHEEKRVPGAEGRMISAMRISMENESRRLRGLRGWRAIKTVDARHPRNRVICG